MPMWDHVLELITQYGYWALFFSMVLGIAGLPIPDETLLVFSGYLITQGKMDPRGAMMAAAAGAVGGISLSYTLGRTLGYSALTRYGRWVRITPARLDQIHKWFES